MQWFEYSCSYNTIVWFLLVIWFRWLWKGLKRVMCQKLIRKSKLLSVFLLVETHFNLMLTESWNAILHSALAWWRPNFITLLFWIVVLFVVSGRLLHCVFFWVAWWRPKKRSFERCVPSLIEKIIWSYWYYCLFLIHTWWNGSNPTIFLV